MINRHTSIAKSTVAINSQSCEGNVVDHAKCPSKDTGSYIDLPLGSHHEIRRMQIAKALTCAIRQTCEIYTNYLHGFTIDPLPQTSKNFCLSFQHNQ
jgi:hypothetical protein